MFRFAIVDDQTYLVESVVTWDGTTSWKIPPGRVTYLVPDSSAVDAGWKVDVVSHTFYQLMPVEDDGVRRLAKIYFLRCFSTEETIRYNALRRQVTNLTDADYTDPTKEPLLQAEVFFNRFDSIDTIELEHPETQMGLQLLKALGLFGTDMEVADQRILDITAGLGPTGEPVAPEATP